MKNPYVLLLVFLCSYLPRITQAQNSPVIISQVYGGAGCGVSNCSTYKNDYIEIFNRSSSPVSLNGWSIQYTASTGTAWQSTPLTNFVLQPGQYYLIAQGAGSNGVSTIPTPDVSGTVAMSAVAGKVALVNTTTVLSGACPINSTVLDFVGFGNTANCREGSVNGPAPSTTTALFRAGGGCTDNNDNSVDFSTATPNARNSSVSAPTCTFPPNYFVTAPVTFTSFYAAYNQTTGMATLAWSTAQEINSKNFEVQRSADGRSWTTLGSVAAAGNSTTPRSYEYTDRTPLAGNNTYRLRQVDLDGTAALSRIATVKTTTAISLQVFPNPATETVSVFVPGGSDATATLSVRDLTGRVMKSLRISAATSGQPHQLNLGGFAKGTYSVEYNAGDVVIVEKLFVL